MDYEDVPAGWNSDRRCGCIFYSEYQSGVPKWYIAANNGYDTVNYSSTEHRCNCPRKYGPYTSNNDLNTKVYTAVCLRNDLIDNIHWTNPSARAWIKSNTCPKGWGPNYVNSNNGANPYVSCAQGYVVEGYQEPVYGYVTRYRTKYYDYISGRVAKS